MKFPKCAGVYAIEHIPTARYYIGSSKTLSSRIAAHLSDLRRGKHENKKLQHSWEARGEVEFRWFVLEQCDSEVRLAREQEWINQLQPYYNLAPVAGTTEGFKFSTESRMKLARSRGLITFGGPGNFETLSDVAAKNGVPLQQLWRRVKYQGLTVEQALTRTLEDSKREAGRKRWQRMSQERRAEVSEKIRAAQAGKPKIKRRKLYDFDGQQLPLHDIAEATGVSFKRLHMRVSAGMDVATAVRLGHLKSVRQDPETALRLRAICANNGRTKKYVPMSDEARARQRAAVVRYNQERDIGAETRKKMSAARRTSPTVERFEYRGETMTVMDMAEKFGIDRHVLRKRINAGWAMEDVIGRPVTKKPRKKAA